MLRVTGTKSTNACKDNQICTGFNTGIDGAVQRVQAIWDANSPTEDWGLLLVDAKNAFNEIDRIRILWTVLHLYLSIDRFVLTVIVTGNHCSCGTELGRKVFCISGRA